jgi:hypothetical protein
MATANCGKRDSFFLASLTARVDPSDGELSELLAVSTDRIEFDP